MQDKNKNEPCCPLCFHTCIDDLLISNGKKFSKRHSSSNAQWQVFRFGSKVIQICSVNNFFMNWSRRSEGMLSLKDSL